MQLELHKLEDIIFRQAIIIPNWKELLKVLHYLVDPSYDISDIGV